MRALRAARHVLLPARRSHHGAAAALAGGRRAVVRGARRPARHRRHRHRRHPVGRRALHGAVGAGHPQARRVGLQGRVLRPQVPRQPAHLRTGLAVRLPGNLLELVPALRAGPVGQRGVQPADHAEERLSRPLHRLRGPVGHHQGPAGQRDGVFQVPVDVLPVHPEAEPRHLRRPVRRRHLDGRGAQGRLGPCHGRRGQSRDPDGVSRGQAPARFHRRHPEQPQGHRHRLRRPPLRRPYQEPLRRHRPVAGRFGRPVEPRRLLHRREVLLYPRGDERLHAGAEAGRHPVGHAVEQGRAAQVGAEALRHHGGRGARRRRLRRRQGFLRRVVLSLDRDRAVQARRLHAGRDRQAQRPYQGDVVRCDLLSRHQGRHGRAEADPAGLPRPVLLRGHAGRSDGPVGEGTQRQAAARHDHDRHRRQDRGQGRGGPQEGRACPPPCSAGWPGTT